MNNLRSAFPALPQLLILVISLLVLGFTYNDSTINKVITFLSHDNLIEL